MAGSHLRGGRTGPSRRLIRTILAALVVGLLVGGAVTLVLLEQDEDTNVGTASLTGDDAVTGDIGLAAANPAAAAERRPITLAFVGDINVELSLATRLADDPDGFVGPFADLLRDADLAIGNLEAAITTGDTPVDKEFTFRAPPSVLDALASGGFDVLSAANDHSLDHGPEVLAETLQVARARRDGGVVIGIGEDEDEAYAPHVVEVGGHRVAVLAATQVLDADRIATSTATADQAGVASAKRVDRLVEEVEAIRGEVDTVVVQLHWGVELETCPSASQQELAQALTDAGADIIVGGHAHRVQGAGLLGRTFVGYGLGNFLFGAVSDEGAKSGVLLVEVDGRDVLGYEWVPGRIADRVPNPLEGDDATAAVDEWNSLRDCTGLTE